MNIIARTETGFLIEATREEVKNILTAVLGSVDMDKVGLSTKIPAIDYATTITKTKALKNSAYFRDIGRELERFNGEFQQLKKVVDSVPEDL